MDPSTFSLGMHRFLGQTGWILSQHNGQRFCRSPEALEEVEHFRKGREVFVNRLPRDCYEDEIYSMFSKAGKIYEIRLMMDFSGTNRGFGYIKYFKRQEADLAVQLLNNREIRQGCRVIVRKSIERSALTVYNVDDHIDETTVAKRLYAIVKNVTTVIIFRGLKQAKIEFDSHKSATQAMKSSVFQMQAIFGQSAHVMWSDPVNAKEISAHRALQKKSYSSQQEENRCPNTNLFISTSKHRHQYNPHFSRNNEHTEFVHNLPVETDNQLRVSGQSDNIQNGKKYLFQKMFHTPTYDCKKQNSSKIGTSAHSYDGQRTTVDNERVTTNNFSACTCGFVTYYS